MKKTWWMCLLFLATTALAQDEWREPLDPKSTELWKSLAEVTPGTAPGQAPSDAIILFDGKSMSPWVSIRGGEPSWTVSDGAMTVKANAGDIKTRQLFGDIQLHVEWRSPAAVKGEGQDRGNSGVYLQERYEVQVLDSYGNQTYANGQAGAVYKDHLPLVNASRKPGEWQTYDIVFTAPRFSEKGTLIIPAYLTVFHNGVLIHNHVPVKGATQYKGLPVYEVHGKGAILLQDHGNAVSYRNIWVREL